ncbi:MAG: cobyrinate a,c-diamide synthase [Rhodospirillales bacterium]|nr:cobyrinate a,c-diamide synthase [Rhodospirillales bacterium]
MTSVRKEGTGTPRLFMSAAHKSSGKTIVSLGLAASFRTLGLAVQPFKKGPDFIDPLWLTKSAGRSCRNLDFHTMGNDEIRACFTRHSASADVAIIEGNKGCFDGVATDGHDSAAALARLLAAPVVLVIDTEGMTRGIAPLLVGYRAFEPDLNIAGIILNKVSGSRHESKLRQAVETYTDFPVLGAIRRSPQLVVRERHLGLVPANEAAAAEAAIEQIASIVASQVDLSALLNIARTAPPFPAPSLPNRPVWCGRRRRIGIASDPAFGFYYPDDLEGLSAAGCDPVFFSTLIDRRLPPDVDGLFLGGGFPEVHMAALEANVELRRDVRTAVRAGMPVYAECGGLMYLSRSISWQGENRAMVGAIDADAVMHARPQGKGYVLLAETENAPWPDRPCDTIPAHEFHYASIENLGADTRFAYKVLRGHGITGRADGIVTGRTLASFSHLRGVGGHPWPHRFAAFVHDTASAPVVSRNRGAKIHGTAEEVNPSSSPAPPLNQPRKVA